MHWAKHLSTDHADCIVRHLVDRGTRDSDGLRHSAKVAWRALALLQTEIEAEQESTRLEDAFAAGKEPETKAEKKHPDQDALGGFDVCCDQPTRGFHPCVNCPSRVCQATGRCMRDFALPY